MYDFSILEGTWAVSDFTGTGADSGGSFDLRMRNGGSISFSNIRVSGDTASVSITRQKHVEAYRNGVLLLEDTRNDEAEAAEFQNVSGNTWRWAFDEGRDGEHSVAITITSQTTADVAEEAGYTEDNSPTVYPLRTSYTLTKQ